jgi:hypothetical protein
MRFRSIAAELFAFTVDVVREGGDDSLAIGAIALALRQAAAGGFTTAGYLRGYPVYVSERFTSPADGLDIIKLPIEDELEGWLTSPEKAKELRAMGLVFSTPAGSVIAAIAHGELPEVDRDFPEVGRVLRAPKSKAPPEEPTT